MGICTSSSLSVAVANPSVSSATRLICTCLNQDLEFRTKGLEYLVEGLGFLGYSL
jgi:hypothetical protein